MTKTSILVTLLGAAIATRSVAQHPLVSYSLRVDSTDLSGYDVTIHIRQASDTFRLGMVAHPEYDGRYWRYVEHLRVDTPGSGGATITREDSALWRVIAPGGSSTVHYRLHLPASPGPARPSYTPFLAPTGGLVGGPHSFMYVIGATLAPAQVTLELPAGWLIATGLEPTVDPHTFFASSVGVLVDDPILVGRFRDWRFSVDGVPHRVVYWPLTDAQPFDTTALVDAVEKLVREAAALFDGLPYRDYTFLMQDGAFGALEHANSVTLGAPSAELARGFTGFLAEAAHEYFHAWNLVRIRPVGYDVDVDYRPPPRSRGLWWAEGVTMFYADLLARRAGLPLFDTTRVAHLEALIARYLASPGNARFSPESVSVVTYGVPPGALGDYSASVHMQGEMIGVALDFLIRDATHGHRSLDDVMRVMMRRYAGDSGYTSDGVERVVAEVCECSTGDFFEHYVRTAHPIDFNRFLALAGLRADVTVQPAVDQGGTPVPDLRLYAWQPPGQPALSLIVTDPAGAWGRAGLHSGDRLQAVNGTRPATTAELRALVARWRVGDTVTVVIDRTAGPYRTTVVLPQLARPVVRIVEIEGATSRQQDLRSRWEAGTPTP